MGKTRRYSPEGEDFSMQDYRVRRRDIAKVNHYMASRLISQMQPVIRVYVDVVPPSLIETGWIPARGAALSVQESFVRDQRLDLIQTLGEQMLQAELGT